MTYKFIIQARNLVGLSVPSTVVSILAAQIPDAPTNLQNVEEVTNRNTIGLDWEAPVFDGGSALLDYSVWYDNALGGDFELLQSGVTDTLFTAASLTQGLTYQFKIQARNLYGFSSFSNTVSILTAQEPDQPGAPTTVWSPDDVIVTWTAPNDGGSPITGFIVTFRQSDELTFSPETVNCDMTSSTDVTCTLPVSVLKAEPFSLPWGASVFAKVVATNLYGNSVESLSGNGAVITVTPDPPTDLTEDYSQRTKSTLAFSWLAPVFTGGAEIVDYRVSIAE